MSTRREKIYRCTLTTRSRQLVGHVRAWDEREAIVLFREELAETGVSARGSIQVKDLSTGPAYPVEFAAL